MAIRRILYTLAAIFAASAFIFYEGYVALMAVGFVFSLPVISIGLCLLGILKLYTQILPSSPALERNEEADWVLHLEGQGMMPCPSLQIQLVFENQLTGWTDEQFITVPVFWQSQKYRFSLDSTHCGQMTCRCDRIYAIDYLGLFSIPIRIPKPAVCSILPCLSTDCKIRELSTWEIEQVEIGHHKDADYDLRDYRPGDELKQIHWKATARRDHIVVKEIIANHIPRIMVIVDLCGSPSQMDRLLDRVLGTSFQLVSMGYPHEIIRSDHADEASPIIYSKDDALQMMRKLVAFPGAQNSNYEPQRYSDIGAVTIWITPGTEIIQ